MPHKKKLDNKATTLKDLIKKACDFLNLPQTELEAEFLLAYLLKKDRAFILAHLTDTVSSKQEKKFLNLLEKRKKGWSLAVLKGSKEFYGLDFIVNKNVLVPRPETEIMVDGIGAELKNQRSAVDIIDIGTGSGAIIISLAKTNPSSSYHFHASDQSRLAFNIARKNARKHQVAISFKHGDLFTPFAKTSFSNLIIAANLPYLKPSELSEPSIKKEPRSALVSGLNGLWHYSRLFQELNTYLLEHKLNSFSLWCEINPEQSEEIKALALKYFPQAKLQTKNDYSKRIRFFVLSF